MFSSDLLGGEPFRFPGDKRAPLHEEWKKGQQHVAEHGIRVQIKCAGSSDPRWLRAEGTEVKLVEQQDATIWTVTPLGASVYAFAAPKLPQPYLGGDPDFATALMEPNTTDASAGKHWWYLEKMNEDGDYPGGRSCCTVVPEPMEKSATSMGTPES